jgi:hypothetical protein
MGFQLVIIVPLFVSLYVLVRQSVEKAVLNVYVPVLLCLPLYDSLKLPNLPALDFADCAILPIGLWALATRWRSWRFSRMDVWMLLLGVSSGAGLLLRNSSVTPGIFGYFNWVTFALFPYIIGKLIIEQGELRIAVMKRFVFLLGVIAILSLYEFRMGRNPFHLFWGMFIPDGFATFEQLRWGFTRVSGPYSQSETTGLVYIVGALFGYWLYRNGQWERKFRYPPHPYTKGTLLLIAVSIGMYINQARGPYLGFALGFLIARTFRGRNLKRGVRNTVLIMLALSAPIYVYMHRYTSADWNEATQDQQNAIYRSRLIDHYIPVVQDGGLWGWGPGFPVVGNQTSIDNAYLFFALTQGYAGVTAFTLLLIESELACFLSLRRVREKQDIGFVFCLGGIIAGIAFCLGTVFLNEPVYEILFLLIGWSQSIRSSEPVAELSVQAVPSARFQFRRVFS